MWSPFTAGNPQGIGQQTLVGRVLGSGFSRSTRAGTRPKRKRKATRKTAARRAVRRPAKRAKRAGRARLVKGSAAAKAYMAKIRRKRK